MNQIQKLQTNTKVTAEKIFVATLGLWAMILKHKLKSWNTILIQRLWLFICCKTKLKKNFFFEKIFVFYKIYVIYRKKCFYMEKKIYREKYKWKCKKKKKNHSRNRFLHRKCLYYKQNINLS